MKQKILVTGGAGFIGSHTVVELIDAGFTPIIVDDFRNSFPNAIEGIKKITGLEPVIYCGDCADYRFLSRVCERENNRDSVKVSGVIHFAAYKSVSESIIDPLKYYSNNIASLVTLLEVMKKQQVEDLVFSSSCTVYGAAQESPVTEDFQLLRAESPYGYSKQISEKIVRDVIESSIPLRATILRYFNPIGAHPSGNLGELPIGAPSNLVPYITQVATGSRDELVVYGNDYQTPDGTAVRDYIHVVDIARAHVLALNALKNGTSSRNLNIYNLGSGIGKSVLEVIRAFENVNGLSLKFRYEGRRLGDIASIFASAKKANSELGWSIKFSLDDALSHAWNWERKRK